MHADVRQAPPVLNPRLPPDLQGWSLLRRPVWLFDPVQFRGLYANAAALELWGAASLDELLGRDFSRLSPAVRSRTEQLALVTAQGRSVSERWSFYPQGRPVTVQAMISSLPLADGSTALLFEATPVDVEEGELRAVEALRHTSSLITLFDAAGAHIFANPAAFAAYGGGRRFADRYQDPDQGAADFADVMDGGVIADLRQVQTSVGERSHFIDVRRVQDPVTGQASVLLSERDVTAQVEAEWAQRIAEERAEVAEAKQRFLANISHELRTPLNSVLGFAGLLGAGALDAAQRSHLDRITDGGEALLRTVNDVIELSELDGGQALLRPAPFAPAALLQDALARAARAATAKGLELELVLPDDAPHLAVLGDADRIRTVVDHYIANAVKFTERGRIVVSLSAAVQPDALQFSGALQVPGALQFPEALQLPGALQPPEALQLEVSVRDTGPGLDVATQRRLFRRFGQGDDGMARRVNGAGLGLAVSKGLIALMGGAVGVESEPGRGARFWFRVTLPVCADEAADGPPDRGADEAEGEAADCGMGSLKILYADDHENNRALIKALLESQGYRCDTVNDGAEAVRAVLAWDYDLVLMDIQMPVQDGVSATRRIRAEPGRPSRVPILALTANTLSGQREAYQLAGLDDCIAKPVNVADLFAKVTYWATAGRAVDDAQGSVRRAS